MKHIIASLIIAICIFSASAQESITQETNIDAIFKKWNSPDTPGGTVGVIKDGKLIFAKGYGMANLDYNIPNGPETVFKIASTSKQFTAACIILLEEQGKLSLNDKLSTFFPKFPAYANDITVQHLLNHTSGIRDYFILARLSGLERDDHYTDKMVEKWLMNQQELNFNPGEEFLYSNSGYWLLGEIVKKVSGVSMVTYAKENIFTPLGMNNTFFNNNHKQVVKNRAYGYSPNRKGGYSISMTTLDMIGDGGVFTTIEDLAKWDASYYSSEILNTDFWKKMTQAGTLNSGEKITYASGLGVSTYKGLKITKHAGAMVGFRAEMIRFPEANFSVIILANRADSNPTRMAYKVANLFLKDSYKNEKRSKNKESVKSIELTKKELKAFEGSYWSTKNKSSRKLLVRNDTLNYDRGNGRTTKMVPVSKNKFQMVGLRVPVILEVKTKEEFKGFTLKSPSATPLTFISYTPITTYSASDLESYSGDYYCAELDVVYTLKKNNKSLILVVKGNPLGEVKQVMEDVISLNSRQTFEFNKTRDEFRLSMLGRVKNLKFVKR